MENGYSDQNTNSTNPPSNPEVIEKKKLCKSRTDFFVDGVCGGLAGYSGVSPFIFRIMFLITGLYGGLGIMVYLILGIILKPDYTNEDFDAERKSAVRKKAAQAFSGSGLIILGFYFFIHELRIIFFFKMFLWHDVFFLPFVLTCGGFFLLRHKDEFLYDSSMPSTKLKRINGGRRLLGLCGGLADYFNTDATFIRLCWILFSFITLGFGAVLYFIMSFMIPVTLETAIEN